MYIVTKVTCGIMLPPWEWKSISQVVEGDLVYNKESPPEESTSVDIAETDDGHTNSSEIDLCSEAQPEETIQSVKVCYGCGTYM